jgi:hypothetical protein
MTLVDVKLTQGSYWKGAQLPYWAYMVVVVALGGLGLDHLLLRSPYTFLMKLLIPTFGFWYLYDIAQVFGERELVEKYGLGMPWYGPFGLGAGMFINKDASNLSPPTIASPWIYMIYAVLSIFFFVFPLNKIIIGDYAGCIAHICMYTILAIFSLGLTAILAICWGIYDAFRVLFDTKGLFEKGAARIFPATLVMDPYFNKGALGPEPGPPDPNPGFFNKITKWFMDYTPWGIAMKLVTPVLSVGTKVGEKAIAVGSTVAEKVADKAGNMAGKVEQKFENKAAEIEKKVDNAVDKAVDKSVNSVVDKVVDLPDKAATAVNSAGKAATIEADAAIAAVQTATAVTDIAKTGPEVLTKVADKLSDPAVQNAAVDTVIDKFLPAAASGIMGKFIPTAPVPGTPAANAAAAAAAAATASAAATAAAPAAVQKGGALILESSSDPAFSSAVLIFSVALLAFGGYVMYSFRKAADLNRNDRPDDSPPDAEPVRGSPKAKRA